MCGLIYFFELLYVRFQIIMDISVRYKHLLRTTVTRVVSVSEEIGITIGSAQVLTHTFCRGEFKLIRWYKYKGSISSFSEELITVILVYQLEAIPFSPCIGLQGKMHGLKWNTVETAQIQTVAKSARRTLYLIETSQYKINSSITPEPTVYIFPVPCWFKYRIFAFQYPVSCLFF